MESEILILIVAGYFVAAWIMLGVIGFDRSQSHYGEIATEQNSECKAGKETAISGEKG